MQGSFVELTVRADSCFAEHFPAELASYSMWRLSYGHRICNDILIWQIITTEDEESGRKVELLMRT